jgi:hypothetical protein
MVIPVGRWVMIAAFAAIVTLLVSSITARTAPVRGINASVIDKASLVEKSVIIHRAPRRYSCWWEGWRRRCGWHG